MEESRGKKIRKDGGVRVACEMGREEKLLNDETICSVKLLAHTSTNSKSSSMATSSVTKRETAKSCNTPIFFSPFHSHDPVSLPQLQACWIYQCENTRQTEHTILNYTSNGKTTHTQPTVLCMIHTQIQWSSHWSELVVLLSRARSVHCLSLCHYWPKDGYIFDHSLKGCSVSTSIKTTAKFGHVTHIMLMHLWLFCLVSLPLAWGCCQVLRVCRPLVNLLQRGWDAVGWPNMIQTLLAMEMCQAANVGCTEAKFTNQLRVK